MKKNIYPLSAQNKMYPHVVLCARFANNNYSNYERIDIKYSLHDDFEDIINFVKRINPKTAIIVHSPASNDENDETIEQHLMLDANCRTQFIFAENQEIYVL